jgi:hypothetical protein
MNPPVFYALLSNSQRHVICPFCGTRIAQIKVRVDGKRFLFFPSGWVPDRKRETWRLISHARQRLKDEKRPQVRHRSHKSFIRGLAASLASLKAGHGNSIKIPEYKEPPTDHMWEGPLPCKTHCPDCKFPRILTLDPQRLLVEPFASGLP